MTDWYVSSVYPEDEYFRNAEEQYGIAEIGAEELGDDVIEVGFQFYAEVQEYGDNGPVDSGHFAFHFHVEPCEYNVDILKRVHPEKLIRGLYVFQNEAYKDNPNYEKQRVEED